MFDFNTKAIAAVATGAVLLGASQTARAATVHQNLSNFTQQAYNSGDAITYQFTFTGIPNAVSATFNADVVEGISGTIHMRIYGQSADAALSAHPTVELQLNGAWVGIDEKDLAVAGVQTGELSILGTTYNFPAADLSGVRLSMTTTITAGTNGFGEIAVVGQNGTYLTVVTAAAVPEPASLGLLSAGAGVLLMRRRRRDGARQPAR